jgi:hypothetical protein
MKKLMVLVALAKRDIDDVSLIETNFDKKNV